MQPPQPPPNLATLEALVVRVVRGNAVAEEALRAWITDELGRQQPQDVFETRRTTALLQGIDVLAQLALDAVRRTTTPRTGADGEWHDASPGRGTLQRLAWLSNAANTLRARRRLAVGDALDHLAVSGDLSTFAHHVAFPLLCRPWLPQLLYEPPGSPIPRRLDQLWHVDAFAALPPLEADAMSGMASLQTLLTRIQHLDPGIAPRARETVAYLQTAAAVHVAQEGKMAPRAPVLLEPATGEWPLGHIVDVMILTLPHLDRTLTADVDQLVTQSLHRAQQAVEYLLDEVPATMAHIRSLGNHVVVGDYPGGGYPVRSVVGPSAGLPLAITLLAHVSGLAWQEGVLATAAITADGTVRPLNRPQGLQQKGRVAGLCGYRAIALAEDGTDGEFVRQGATSVGGSVDISPVATLVEAIEATITDPYKDYLWTLAGAATTATAQHPEWGRDWEDYLVQRDAPDRLVLALPWTSLPPHDTSPTLHVAAAVTLAQALARHASGLRKTRTIPLVLDVRSLTSDSSFLDLAVQVVTGKPEESSAASLRALVRAHLRSGELLLIITGLADVDAHGQYLTTVQATHLLEALDAYQVRRTLLIARGYGEADAPIVARREMLARHGFITRWGAPQVTRQPHPLISHQVAALTDPDGPAFGQLLPLQIAARTPQEQMEDTGNHRLQIATQFLCPSVPDGALSTGEYGIIPRVGQHFHPASVTELRSVGTRWDEVMLHDHLGADTDTGVLLLDGEEREGGTGKSTLLLSLLADACHTGRPALLVSLGDLHTWPRSNDAMDATDLLALVLPRVATRSDAAMHDLLLAHPHGVLVLLDGVNEVVTSVRARFATMVAPRLIEALCGYVPGIRAVIASRAEEWLTTPRVSEHRADLPAPAQLREALVDARDMTVPTLLRLEPLALTDAIAYLRAFPHGAELLAALGNARDALLPHPFTLGLLSIIGHDATTPGKFAARVLEHGRLYQWDVVDIVVDYLIAAGLAPERRQHRGTLEKPLLDHAQARTLLESLAYAMANRDKMPLDETTTLEVVRSALDAAGEAARQARIAHAIEEGRNHGLSSTEISRRMMIITQETTDQRPHGFDASTYILDELCAISLVLVLITGVGYRLLHELIRDVLGSIMFRRDRKQDETEIAFYQNRIANSLGSPTLRAAVRTDLLRICHEGRLVFIEDLCRLDDEEVRGVLVGVLRQYARDYPVGAHDFLARLLPGSDSPRGKRLNRPFLSQEERAAALAAIAVAGSIAADDLLSTTLSSRPDVIRGEAIRQTFLLWQRNPAAALAVLKRAVPQMVRMLVSMNIGGAVACITASLLVMADMCKRSEDPRYREYARELHQLWFDALRRLPLQERSPVERATRTLLIRSLVKYIINHFPEAERYNGTSVAELSHSFVPGMDRAALRRLVQNVEAVTDEEITREDILAAIRAKDLLGGYVTDWLLLHYYRVHPEAAVSLLWNVLDEAGRINPQGLAFGNLGFVFFTIQRAYGTLDHDSMRRYLARLDAFVDRYKGVQYGHVVRNVTIAFDLTIVFTQALDGIPGESAIVQRHFDKAIRDEDHQFLLDGLWFMQQLRHEPRYYQSLLANLAPLFAYGADETGATRKARRGRASGEQEPASADDVHRAVVNLVAALRAAQPAEVDAFLEQSGAARPFIEAVTTVSVSEHIVREIVMGGVSYWLTDIVLYLLESTELRRRLIIPILMGIASSRTLTEWLTLIVTTCLDELYREAG